MGYLRVLDFDGQRSFKLLRFAGTGRSIGYDDDAPARRAVVNPADEEFK
jgi:hypothetical protein